MALAYVTQNGKGLGHLVRTRIVCSHLRTYGIRPIVFAQGEDLEPFLPGEQVRCIPHFWKLSDAERALVAREILDSARLSEPTCIVEDTHPLDFSFPTDVRRALLLRPTTFASLLDVLANPDLRLARVFVADHPDSPTWPYTDDEWKQLSADRRVTALGPIFSRASAESIRDAQDIVGRDPFCIVSAGGGGQLSGRGDIPAFVDEATEVVQRISDEHPDMRFIFVKGPFFPVDVVVPEPFECLDESSCMPALFALASGAIIRPGFNSLWECLVGRTPTYPILGETFEEPVGERLSSIGSRGLLTVAPERDWWDEQWRAHFNAEVDAVARRWPGYPVTAELSEFVRGAGVTQVPGRRWPRRALLISVNGIGMGHVTRTLRLGKRLIKAGVEVQLAIESSRATQPPGLAMPTTMLPEWPYDPYELVRYLPELEALVDSFDPHCIILDRHRPLPDGVVSLPYLAFRQKVAIASLPSPGLLAALLEDRDVDETFLLHSAADFETLFGRRIVRLVRASDRVRFAGGPILDRDVVLPSQRAPIPKRDYVLLVIGGGGEHEGMHDTETIGGLAADLASYLHREHELSTVLVHGPYFPHRNLVDSPLVTCYAAVANLHELIRRSQLTVFRPGFNLSREVFGGAPRYVALDTYQSEEATPQHLAFLAARAAAGVSPLRLDDLIREVDRLLATPPAPRQKPPWRNATASMARRLAREDNGVWRRAEKAFSALAAGKILAIRIDDVTCADEPLAWQLGLLAERRIPASLEVIPYLREVPESWIRRFDREAVLFEVSQHGCRHINLQETGEHYGEYAHPITSRLEGPLQALREGMLLLAECYGERFCGGFSPPFDNLPDWLPKAWAVMGGRYLSTCTTVPTRSILPYALVGPDVWCWDHDRPRSPAAVLGDLYAAMLHRGYGGLVLHPRRFDDATRDAVATLLDFLADIGFAFERVSRLAALPADRLSVLPPRDRLAPSRTLRGAAS